MAQLRRSITSAAHRPRERGATGAANKMAAARGQRRYRTRGRPSRCPGGCCTAPGSLDNRLGLGGAPEGLLIPGGASGVGAAVAILLDQPFRVVEGGEGTDGVADFVDGLPDAAVHAVRGSAPDP